MVLKMVYVQRIVDSYFVEQVLSLANYLTRICDKLLDPAIRKWFSEVRDGMTFYRT